MKRITEPCLSITTKINGTKVYVSGMSNRFDGKIIPVYSNDSNLSHDYESPEKAEIFIKLFVNLNNYVFETETINVPVDRKKYLKGIRTVKDG